MNHTVANGMQQARALAWEFWARGWRGQLLGLAGVIALASILYGAILSVVSSSDLSFRSTASGASVHFGLFWVTLVFLGAPTLLAWGAPERRYTLPTSSFLIVACPMACAMVSIFLLHATAATTVNILFDAGWPIWVPGLLAALLVAWAQAILWSTSNSAVLQALGCFASLGVLILGVTTFAPPDASTTARFSESLGASHLLMFGLASGLCVGAGTVGFANLRRGNGLDVDRIVEWANRIFPVTTRSTPFSSPTSAQLWLEWMDRGRVMPIVTTLIGVPMLFGATVATGNSEEFVGGMSMMLLIPSLVVGIYLGARSATGEFGNFNGSRPLTDSQIARAVLSSATTGVLSSALIWAGFMTVAVLIVGLHTGVRSLYAEVQQTGPSRLLATLALGIGVVCGVVGLVTSTVLAGKRVGAIVLCSVVGVLITVSVVPLFLQDREALAIFERVGFFVCFWLPLFCILAIFGTSWWLGLISRKTLLLAASITVSTIAIAHIAEGLESPQDFLIPLWLGCMISSPLGAAPLAVWWNRHR